MTPSGMAIAGGIGSHTSASGVAYWIQNAIDPGGFGVSVAELAKGRPALFAHVVTDKAMTRNAADRSK